MSSEAYAEPMETAEGIFPNAFAACGSRGLPPVIPHYKDMVNIYVLNKDGTPLMPMHSWGRAKRFLKTGKAWVVRTRPFTIRLKDQRENPALDRCVLGIDPGRTNIGLCAADSRGRVLFSANVITRNKQITRLMDKRRACRRASRRGERKVRQRRAIAADKTGMAKATEFWRMLPGCKKPICCKVLRNTPAKFEHRKRPAGWRTPTAEQLYRTHLHAIHKVMEFIPISSVAIEMNRFDFAKMENPGIRNWEYQKGRLFGFKSKEEAISFRQEGKCLLCGKKGSLHCHHVIPRSQGGSESIDNLAGLCPECHGMVHKDTIAKARLAKKMQGMLKEYHALSVINQIMPALLTALASGYETFVTTGWETKRTRAGYGLPEKHKDDRTHYIDAWCIAVSAFTIKPADAPDFESSFYTIKQYRRHDRARIKAQKERTYYLDGKDVAKNRHARTGQADTKKPLPSLAQYRALHPKDVAALTVKKSRRSYNDMNRILPGAEIMYSGKRYVLHARQTNGTKYYAEGCKQYFPSKKCSVARHNAGLVFI